MKIKVEMARRFPSSDTILFILRAILDEQGDRREVNGPEPHFPWQLGAEKNEAKTEASLQPP